MDHGVGVGFAGFEDAGREGRLVGGVREDLGFEAAGRAVRVFCSALAGHGAVEEVAAIELNAGLIGVDLHGASGLRVVEGSGVFESLAVAEHPAVVVAASEFESLVLHLNPFADGGGFG